MDPINFDDACRHVGRLYFESQQQLDRQLAFIQQLQAEIASLKEQVATLERESAR